MPQNLFHPCVDAGGEEPMGSLGVASLLFAGHERAKVVEALRSIGVAAVDLWSIPGWAEHVRLDEDDPIAIAAELQQNGVRPCALSLYTRDPQRLRRGVEFAARLGAPIVVNGAVGRDWGELATFLRPALDAAAQTGIRLAIENHTDTLLDSGDRMAEFCRRFPADLVGIAFAPPHAWVVGERPNELVHRFADRLLLVYLWDVAPQNRGLAWWRQHWHEFPEAQFPGEGILDFVALADALQRTSCPAQQVICLHGTELWSTEQLQRHLQKALTFLQKIALTPMTSG